MRRTGSAGSRSRLTCVRYLLALTANTKPSGVRARHCSKVSLAGSR